MFIYYSSVKKTGKLLFVMQFSLIFYTKESSKFTLLSLQG